ncbi:MAG: TolC family protein [Candidatus Obscuribacterales bacterium]|nr:TolC family protein [Candidatus Obscuribacterales bacterium]
MVMNRAANYYENEQKRANLLSPGFFSAYLLVCLFLLNLPFAAAATPPAVIKAADSELRGAEKEISLMRAFDEALIRSPRVGAIRLLLGISKAELIRATEMDNPSIFMDNGYRAEFTYRYGFTVPLEMPWKIALRVALAKNQIKQTDLEIIKALWNFRADVRRAYTNLVLAQELNLTLQELVDLTSRLQKIARKRFEAGEVSELDVFRAEQEATKAIADKAQQSYRVTEAQQALSLILGRSATDEISAPRLPPDGPAPEAAGILPGPEGSLPSLSICLQQAMKNRPELKVIQQTIRTNGANLKLAVANIVPNPTIGVGSSVVNGPAQPQSSSATSSGASSDGSSSSGSPSPPNRTNFHGFFFQVFQQLPIFDVQQGDIAQFRATARQLKAELAGQENLVSSEVATAYQRVLGARKKIEIYQNDLLKKTLEIARLARLGYEVGASDINATLLAQQSTIQIKTEYLDALSAYQQAFTDLEQSIGTTLQ